MDALSILPLQLFYTLCPAAYQGLYLPNFSEKRSLFSLVKLPWIIFGTPLDLKNTWWRPGLYRKLRTIIPLTNDVRRHIYCSMIKSFQCKDTEKLFDDYEVKRFRGISRAARMKLEILHATVSLDGLKIPPGNRLEPLAGDRKGQHSIRINAQWRSCFVWKDGNAHDVAIVDYH